MENNSEENAGGKKMRRQEYLPSGKIVFQNNFDSEESLIPAHLETEMNYSAVSVVRVSDVKIWSYQNTICVYDDVAGINERLSLTGKPIDFTLVQKTPVSNHFGRVVMFPHLSTSNYYHWLVEAMPCFGVMDMAGITSNDYDNLYIHYYKPFQQKHLDKLAFNAEKLLSNENRVEHFSVKELIIPYFRLDGGWPNPWAVEYLKKTWIPDAVESENVLDSGAAKKVYLVRGNARRGVTNEKELIERLERQGYLIVDVLKMSLEEQAKCLGDADFVLAPHGAALANIVFCRPGTKILEFTGQYLTYHFRMLSELNGLIYRSISAKRSENGESLPVSVDATFKEDDYLVNMEYLLNEADKFFGEVRSVV